VTEIDTTSRSPEDVVEEMINILKGISDRRIGEIDWLSKISQDDRLDYFFR